MAELASALPAQKKPDTGPASLKKATALAAKGAVDKAKKKKKGKRDAQGRLIMEEVKIVAGQ